MVVGVLVVDRGVVVEFGAHGVGGQGMRDLNGGVDVQGWQVGDHAAEQGDLGRVPGGQCLDDGELLHLGPEVVIRQGGELGGSAVEQPDQSVELLPAEEQQVGGLVILLD